MSNAIEFEIKRTKALEILRATGMRKGNYKPPLWRLLWRLGVKVPPPHFIGFGAMALAFGTYFAVAVTLATWLVDWIRRGRIYLFPIVFTAIGAVIYGVGMSMYYDAGRKKHQLPNWSSLGRK
jgi:hypothetical protein